MNRSRLQDPFMQDIAANFKATKARITRRIAETPNDVPAIVEDELRGLYHGLFVVFDGGTVLADDGLISIIDEEGEPFDRFLHEICFSHWPLTES